MEENTREVEIRLGDVGQVLKRCWIVILATVIVVFCGLYALLNALHVDEYEANVTIYILRNSNENEEESPSKTVTTSDISIANALIDDCKILMLSRDHVLTPVLEETPSLSDTTWKDLKKMITIENSGEDRVLTLSVRAATPALSADLANKVANHACDYFNEKYQQPISSVVDYAEVPTGICNPVSILLVALVSFAAACIVFAIYFVCFLMDDKVNSGEDVEKYLELSVLGVIPNRQDSARHKSKYGYYRGSSQQKPAQKK